MHEKHMTSGKDLHLTDIKALKPDIIFIFYVLNPHSFISIPFTYSAHCVGMGAANEAVGAQIHKCTTAWCKLF